MILHLYLIMEYLPKYLIVPCLTLEAFAVSVYEGAVWEPLGRAPSLLRSRNLREGGRGHATVRPRRAPLEYKSGMGPR